MGIYGDAVLRLGMGRSSTLSKQPTVLVNGTAVDVPTDFMGHEGDSRSTFFGVLDIPVPYHLLQANNEISVTFPDTGGYISSVSLRAYAFSADLRGTGPVKPIITATEMIGNNLKVSISNGGPNGFFDLVASPELTVAKTDWVTTQAGMQFDGMGQAVVMIPVLKEQEFFRIIGYAAAENTITATFDWEEFTGVWWSDGFGYVEIDNGVSLVTGGRAAAHQDGYALKASYWQDSTDGTFNVQIDGVDQEFTVTSIDISASTDSAPDGAAMVKGMLGGVEQWTIDPTEDVGYQTYTSATTGDMSVKIDQIIWSAPYDSANPSTQLTWGNKIDNLHVSVDAP